MTLFISFWKKEKNFVYSSQKILLETSFNSELEVQKELFKLLDKIWQNNIIYRSCGVCVYNIQNLKAEQISLIEADKNKNEKNNMSRIAKPNEKNAKEAILDYIRKENLFDSWYNMVVNGELTEEELCEKVKKLGNITQLKHIFCPIEWQAYPDNS